MRNIGHNLLTSLLMRGAGLAGAVRWPDPFQTCNKSISSRHRNAKTRHLRLVRLQRLNNNSRGTIELVSSNVRRGLLNVSESWSEVSFIIWLDMVLERKCQISRNPRRRGREISATSSGQWGKKRQPRQVRYPTLECAKTTPAHHKTLTHLTSKIKLFPSATDILNISLPPISHAAEVQRQGYPKGGVRTQPHSPACTVIGQPTSCLGDLLHVAMPRVAVLLRVAVGE
ncbi:hypothetical protein BKA65DRAFT_108862 [Rhexocercosporidium sp. MPI-PUGE-AT-0058]|nr:hypothetical protein BKA65DRAFT_108862 [Rhexocercosporidium sp. MPI-PUGE-AT-0058]